ncbi:hemin binding protein [Nitratireductor indicus C115]|uniref:Hemin binding protein n=1 Tax=Nitratireductor indicus C115 TaxID=1231190 RepID=K2PS13_9HYPH|nr:ABC transporter substrate-binding protein [Nitratireductor indicus]EKF43872.1 hemin binding protein [Nitratireductor indicus C115]SFQ15125.1 iron complex transport system substrate-binding protein [Nitratireductor indicus]
MQVFRKPARAMRLNAIAAACLLSSALLAPASADEVETFRDSSRIVSVGGALTEIVYGLGEEGRLVARDTTSTYPESVREIQDVGYMRALSPEGVLSVNPTAIIAAEGSGPETTMSVLEKADVDMVVVPEGYSREGILRKIRVIGTALGVEEKAQTLAAKVDSDLRAAEKAAREQTGEKRVLFILSMQGGRVLAAGGHTAADGIIQMAGAINAVEGYSGYKQMTDEAIAEAAPDVILMMKRGEGPERGEDQVFAHPAISGTPAGRNRALITMDGSYLLGFGPRTASAIRDLSARLHDVKAATD